MTKNLEFANNVPVATSFTNIQKYSRTLYDRIKAKMPLMPFDLKDFPLLIKMGFKNSTNDLGQFFMDSSFDEIVAVLGIDDKDNFTISFLGIKGGKIDEKIPGQETWPPSDITTYSETLTYPI